MSGVQVVHGGNPRQGGMDQDERDQCVLDIVGWFQRKGAIHASTASNADVEALEKELGHEIPEALAVALKKQNGGLWFNEYKSLDTEDIVKVAEKLASVKGWKASFVPFAADVDGNALITDASGKSAVYPFGEDGKGAQLAATLAQYLEDYRNQLLSGQFDYVEDVGLVERSRK